MNDQETKEVIISMLKENTGKHFLDSGGAYGRNWEQNQIREFENEPYGFLDFGKEWMYYYKNVYHHLTENLEYDDDMNQRFLDYVESNDPDFDWNWFKCARKFINDPKNEFSGLYNEGSPFTENTYNLDNSLSQDFQFSYFETEDSAYILLMIHGGCDIRGGYTDPKAFKVIEPELFLRICDGTIKCESGHFWYMDQPFDFEPAYRKEDNDIALTDCKIIKISDFIEDNDLYLITESEFIHRLKIGAINYAERLDHQLNLIPDVPKPIRYQINDDLVLPDNVIWVTEEDKGLCPICYEPLTADV